MKRGATLAIAALLVIGTLLGWLLAPTGGDSPDEPATVATAPPRVPALEPVVPASARPAPPVADTPDERRAEARALELEEEKVRLISQDARLQERARQQQLAAEADLRWHEAVDGGEYSAADLDPAVRSLFSDIDLEARYTEGGRIEGLVIESMVGDHPLALSGFRAGDRIDRIQGVPLRDPADLPSLLAHLGPNISVCVEREGAELCRDLHLE